MAKNSNFIFRFSVTSPSEGQIKLVGGSIDENLCGKLEENNIRFKYINENCWEGKASIAEESPPWIYFYVMFSIGQHADWSLQVFQSLSDGTRKSVYEHTGNTGPRVHDAVEWKVDL